MGSLGIYLTLLACGFVLVGTEIFLPGGILGLFGALFWVGAAVVSLRGFPAPWNLAGAIAVLFIGLLTFFLWIRYFPRSRIGRSLSLEESAADFKSPGADEELRPGMEGRAESHLRPSGIARFGKRRVDVVADGEWIEAGTAVKITSVEGARVCVVAVRSPSSQQLTPENHL